MPSTNVSTPVTLKASPGIIRSVNVCVAGTGNGMVCDAASVGTAATSNAVIGTFASGGRAGPIVHPITCGTGITVVPGTGQTLWVDWE